MKFYVFGSFGMQESRVRVWPGPVGYQICTTAIDSTVLASYKSGRWCKLNFLKELFLNLY